MRMRKEVVLCLMLITAFVCLRFPFSWTLFSNTIKTSAPKIVTDEYLEVLNEQRIYCKRYPPTKDGTGVTVVLLHGARFSSQTWEDIQTLSHLAEKGILALAIDLPGYGKSKNVAISKKAEFLKHVVDDVEGEVKIIVSPSVSGGYSIPYINKHGEEIDGYVPVAPIGTEHLAPQEETKEKLSVLAVAGETDTQGVARISIFQQKFDKVDQLIIPKAGHPAYLTDPDLFNSRLSEFALSLKQNG